MPQKHTCPGRTPVLASGARECRGCRGVSAAEVLNHLLTRLLNDWTSICIRGPVSLDAELSDLCFLFPSHHVHYGNRGDLHNGVDIITCLQHMDRCTHAEQDRTDRLGFAQASQQLVSDIRRFK